VTLKIQTTTGEEDRYPVAQQDSQEKSLAKQVESSAQEFAGLEITGDGAGLLQHDAAVRLPVQHDFPLVDFLPPIRA
jgi:hypothetical protein